jgi:hypothetical protein
MKTERVLTEVQPVIFGTEEQLPPNQLLFMTSRYVFKYEYFVIYSVVSVQLR